MYSGATMSAYRSWMSLFDFEVLQFTRLPFDCVLKQASVRALKKCGIPRYVMPQCEGFEASLTVSAV
ncbi:hypothetical protein NJ69_15805 [Pseudomonas parafulva]|nr:hypothetical protein NJ69_15805 [Pseudomonas parafulva]